MSVSVEAGTRPGGGSGSILPVSLVSFGHGGIHLVAAVFYLLLPSIRVELGLDYAQIGVLVSVFFIASLAANFPSGLLVDTLGRHAQLQAAALMVGGLALVGMGLTHSFVVLAACVALIGATNMLWHPAAIPFLSDLYPRRRGLMLSVHGLGASAGDALGPLFAGVLIVWFGWQGAAVGGGLVAPLIGLLILLLLAGPAGERRLASVRESADVAPASRPGGSYRAGMWALVRQKAIWALCLMAGLRSVTQAGLLTFLPLYMADVLGFSTVLMGVVLMGLQLGGAAAGPIAGHLSDRHGRRRVVMAGLTGTTVLVLSMPLIDNQIFLVGLVAALGFFMYAVRPVIHSWAMDLCPAGLGGSMTSLMFGAQSGLSALMPVVGGVIADSYGLVAVFYCLGVTVLIANTSALLVPRSIAWAPDR